MAEVWSICRQHLIQGDLDQLVLDELGLAVAFGYCLLYTSDAADEL